MKSGALFFVIVLQCGTVAAPAAPVRFEEHFTEGALRLDLVHSGTVDEERVALRRVLRGTVWSGCPEHLIPEHEMGKYRLDVREGKSGELIFRYGFSTLFGEWATTEEAKSTERAFEETLEVPMPKRPVDVEILARVGGQHRSLFRATVDPGSHLIGRSAGLAQFRDAEVVELEVHGDPRGKVDLLVLGDGYTAVEQGKFMGDCRRFMTNFFGSEPMSSMRVRFNVRAVFVPSGESGIDEPRKGIFRDTPFGMTFSMFDLPRYCMSEALWAIHDAASDVPHDAILLMGNSARYGGGAIFNFYTAFISDNEYDDYMVVHEFGHGFGGLGDEYYTSSVAYNEFYPRGLEPWEPNLTALLDPAALKWRRFVEEGTPLPTPEDGERYAGKVGAFEGAGYAAKGLFRPEIECRMFSKGNRAFCRVCANAMAEMIERYGPDTTSTWRPASDPHDAHRNHH